MGSRKCPNCGDEMEEVIGFKNYIWCRDCHITKKLEERKYKEDGSYSNGSKEVTTEILDLIDD